MDVTEGFAIKSKNNSLETSEHYSRGEKVSDKIKLLTSSSFPKQKQRHMTDYFLCYFPPLSW